MKATVFFCFILLISSQVLWAQNVSRIYQSYIETVQLYPSGNQQGLPVYALNSGEKLQLDFDDLQGGYKNYYYTYVLCDYNWKPANLSTFDYVKGFSISRINTYRYSSIAYTKYTHYQATLPEQNAMPFKSGNYLLKVFLDGDTSKTIFTKQMMIVDASSNIAAEVKQPFTPALFNSHQRIKFSVSINNLNSFSAAQQIKAVVLQNNRWDIAQRDIQPTFVRGNALEYNTENIAVFPAGKEWRWLDITSFLLQSDRIADARYDKKTTEFWLKPDFDRSAERYLYFPDYNGMYSIRPYEAINPFWQGDYATVHFRYANDGGKPFVNKKVYLAGAFTDYALAPKWEMKFNDSTGLYEQSAFLKQGYYNYTYLLADDAGNQLPTSLEGNYWEAENTYTVLIYYKGFTDRVDQLIGVSQINSRRDRKGFSF